MRTKVFLASLLAAASLQMTAQNANTVGGCVVDENGEPVIGAQVKVKGAKTGTITDVDGNFSLPDNVKSGTAIEINYLGMEPQTVKGAHGMKIKMVSKNQQLDEVIVVAYGQQKKSSFTGSAGVIDANTIATRPLNNVADALEGQVAGVQVYKTSGDPSATPTFLIRGISSINANQTPLIIVDGAPFSGSWNDINPADVASITVLKDAASNAMYGARGANGVIMVTTKNPQKGRTVVTLDAKWGSTSRASETYDMITDPGQYYEMQYKAIYNKKVSDGISAYNAHVAANNILGSNDASSGGLGYMCYTVPDGQYLIGDNGKLNPNATLGKVVEYNGQKYTITPDNWLDESLRHTLREEYNINVNGGNDGAQLYASLGYLNEPGIAYGSGMERYTARLKATLKASDWLKVGGNVNYAHTNTDQVGSYSGYNIFYAASRVAPIYPLYIRDGEGNIMTDSNGKMYDYGDGTNGGLLRPCVEKQTNPLKDDQIQTNNSLANSFQLTGFADITPTFIDGLKVTLNGTVSDYEYRYTSTTQPFYGWSAASYPDGYVSKYHYRSYAVNFQELINYAKSFGLHNMTLLLGHENNKSVSEDLSASRTGMFSYYGNQELSGAIKDNSGTSSQSKYNTEGYFFRGMYDYDGKYFGQLSFRRDASSRFTPSNRWGNFYSFGGAWIITKEKWMESSKSWLDMLKLKLSFGQQGNDGIDDYLYRDLYEIRNDNDEVGVTIARKGNPDITWETNTNVNVGVEFALFNNKLSGSLEYFYRKTTDMLSYVYFPKSYGYDGRYENVGDMVNKGIELSLVYTPIRTKDINWNINLNATHYRNKIVKLNPENRSSVLDGHYGYTSSYSFYGEGLPIYTWRLPKYAGVDDDGQSMWYTIDKNGKTTTTTTYSEATYYACGDPTPDLYGGFGTSLNVKGFDFTINFSYSIGGKVFDYGYQNLMACPTSSTVGYNFHKDLLNAWSADNKGSDIPRFQFGDTYANSGSDRFLTNGSWLSLQNISLGYTLPQSLTSRIGLSKVRFYATADNVYLWSKRKGLDPRTSTSGSPGTENYSFTRTISGGVTLQF
jgi:TonB-linked SusC/RagA family outer membrane protein